MEEVEHVLESLRSRKTEANESDALVAPMARGRWAHLLGGPVEEGGRASGPYGCDPNAARRTRGGSGAVKLSS